MNTIEVVVLSKNNMIITFNKQALKALEKGASEAIKLKQGFGKKDITFLFIRDKYFKARYQEYTRSMKPKKSFWLKLWPFGKDQQVNVRETQNRKYKDIKK